MFQWKKKHFLWKVWRNVRFTLCRSDETILKPSHSHLSSIYLWDAVVRSKIDPIHHKLRLIQFIKSYMQEKNKEIGFKIFERKNLFELWTFIWVSECFHQHLKKLDSMHFSQILPNLYIVFENNEFWWWAERKTNEKIRTWFPNRFQPSTENSLSIQKRISLILQNLQSDMKNSN